MIVQRVLNASVKVNNEIVGAIDHGLMVLIGITHDDTIDIIRSCAKKLTKLRIFNDENGKMNKSIQDVEGKILLVSQFTLYGDASKGNRPSFISAAKPELANLLYEEMKKELQSLDIIVESGVFGADMKVSLVNDGPVTIILE